MSRLDRIYTSEQVAKLSFDWKIKQTSVLTDHWMVSTKYAPAQAPFIGKERWMLRTMELKNRDLMERIINQGKQLNKDVENLQINQKQRETKTPQTLWATFKKDITKITKKPCVQSRGKTAAKIRKIEEDMEKLKNNAEIDTNDEIRANEAYLANELKHLEHIHTRDNKDDLRVIITNHGEVLGGVWSAMNKDRKPRDLLYRLRDPNTNGEGLE